MKVLYVSNNGLLEPIGHSQIFRYVMAQAARHAFVIISFEKAEEQRDTNKTRLLDGQLRGVGARWRALRYLNRKPRFISASLNLIRGSVAAFQTARQQKTDVIHARSYIGALIALPASVLLGIPFLFDMRGFWPDEGIGVARWAPGSLTYRVLKRLERVLLRRAGGIVTLTESGAAHLEHNFPDAGGGRPIVVIPTCADISRFHPPARRQSTPLVLGYAGSANEAYLFEDFLLTFLELRRRRPDARMLILNRKDHDYIRRELAAKQIPLSSAEIKAVDHEQVPDEMREMTIGTIFVRPYLAKIGSAPTKMAEFLATGVPCLGNAGCGDVAAILEREQIGVSIDTFSPAGIAQMVDRILLLLEDPHLSSRCREYAQQQFSLEMACRKYDQLYSAVRLPHAQAPS